MKRLYLVKVSYEIVVSAPSVIEARRAARMARVPLDEIRFQIAKARRLKEGGDVPWLWRSTTPYPSHYEDLDYFNDDRTVLEILREENASPSKMGRTE